MTRPSADAVLRTLTEPLTTRQVADALGCLPGAALRALVTLLERGQVEEVQHGVSMKWQKKGAGE